MSVKFNEGKSMVSIRLPNDLFNALIKVARKEEITLTAVVEEFCREYIENNFCESCQKKLYGIIPDDGKCDQ